MVNNINKTRQKSMGWPLIYIAIVCTTLSQIEPIAHLLRPTMYLLWGLVIFVGCLNGSGKIKLSKYSLLFIVSFVVFYAFCLLASSGEQNYLRVLAAPLLITLACDLYEDCTDKRFNIIVSTYIVSALIYAIWVHFTYFRSYSSWLMQSSYVFVQKNSAGQIWCAAVLILIFLIEYETKRKRLLGLMLATYFIAISGISQCRTSVLGIAVAIVLYAVYKSKKKFRWIVAIIFIVIVIWNIPFTHEFIDQALLLSRYQGTDLNTFSSGRLGYYEEAVKVFLQAPIIGCGNYYVDCSYLLILAESGIIGLIIIEPVWIKKIAINLTYKGKSNEMALLFTMTVFYLVESVLEGYPPFGPGVSSFMFWLISGIIIKRRNQHTSISFS